jgi:hypothetical protein
MVRYLNNKKLFKWLGYSKTMATKIAQIIGIIMAVVGFILIVSSITGYTIEFLPLKDGIFALGFVLVAIGLLVASKLPEQ